MILASSRSIVLFNFSGFLQFASVYNLDELRFFCDDVRLSGHLESCRSFDKTMLKPLLARLLKVWSRDIFSPHRIRAAITSLVHIV